MSKDQTSFLDHRARICACGAGTKTGKTVACAIWALEGLLQGERVAWIGPWYKRSKLGYEHLRSFLRDWEKAGFAKCRDADLSIDVYETTTGRVGHLECFSGDNPDSVYGEAFDRVVIDEATRMPEATFHSARSTITATGGRMRVAFNTDRGARHWAIRLFLTAQRGEDPTLGAVTMPTSASPYVKAEDIEQAKRLLPERVFRALYNAEIFEDGASVFGDPRRCVKGVLEPPIPGTTYVIGADLAKKHDYTVLTVFNRRTRHVVAWERFHGMTWKMQREKIKALSLRYNKAKVVVDATGLGDPNIEELIRDGVWVEPFIFSAPSKRELVERLVVAIEKCEISYPDIPQLLTELDAYEFDTTASGNIVYQPAEGFTDDAVMSLGLGLWGCGAAASADAASLYQSVRCGESFMSMGGLACL